MIEFCDVSYAYGEETVLSHISFRVPKGKTAFLSGSNGTGKSTLLKIINGIAFPGAGEYRFMDEPITFARLQDSLFAKSFHQKIGYVWQNPDAQLFCSSVEEEIAFGPRQMGLSNEEVERRVEDALQLLELGKLRNRAPYFLSGGEKKKTAIAAIFVMNPMVWTLDEPLNDLDRETQDWLIKFLLELKNNGKTIVFSSHDDFLAEKIADMELAISRDHTMNIICD